MSERVILSGYYGFENFGDELILSVMTQQLKALGFIPVVLSGNPKETRQTYGVESLQRTEVQSIWQAMENATAFISGGGGLFQDVTGPGSPIYYGGLIEMAAWRKLPIAVFGQGVGPLRSGFGRWITGRELKHASLVVVRDVKSQVLVQQLTQHKPDLMADPVWTWTPAPAITALPKKTLGISLRPWPDLGNTEIKHLASSIAQWPNIQETGINLIDCQSGTDIIPLAKLEQRLKELKIPCHWFGQDACIQGIAQSQAIIGMRYHALLIAAQLGIPSIAISYDPKVQLLAAQLKIPDTPVSELLNFRIAVLKENLCLPDAEVVLEFRDAAQKGFQRLKKWLRC
jgi:polysaccharide pyruvyl transferase CsaB